MHCLHPHYIQPVTPNRITSRKDPSKACNIPHWCDRSCHWCAKDEPNTVVHPSNVSGLGVFTTKKIISGQTICRYSGIRRSTRFRRRTTKGYMSKYMLQAKWKNSDTGEWEWWCLDSTSVYNRSGRYINDAMDLDPLDGNTFYLEDMPESLKTPYFTNCRFSTVIKVDTDPRMGAYYYVDVIAITDIDKDTELFARYGEHYWTDWCDT